MRLKTVTTQKAMYKSKTGEKSDSRLFLFYFPNECREKVDELNKLAKQAKVKRFTYSYCLREGLRLLVKQQRMLLSKALRGTFHAKRRTVIMKARKS